MSLFLCLSSRLLNGSIAVARWLRTEVLISYLYFGNWTDECWWRAVTFCNMVVKIDTNFAKNAKSFTKLNWMFGKSYVVIFLACLIWMLKFASVYLVVTPELDRSGDPSSKLLLWFSSRNKNLSYHSVTIGRFPFDRRTDACRTYDVSPDACRAYDVSRHKRRQWCSSDPIQLVGSEW